MPDEKPKRLPTYTRADAPPAMRLTERDKAVLDAIHRYDGMLADYQIQQLFFHDERYFKQRMSFLFHNGYVSKPERKERAQLDYTVYWLDKKGADYLAGSAGLTLKEFAWVRPTERWNQVPHDVKVNDVRIAVESMAAQLPAIAFREWVGESAFRRYPDQIQFVNGTGKKLLRIMRPDGYFLLEQARPDKEKPDRLRFLLELDKTTHSAISFVEEKVRPGIAYILSPQYKTRFGANFGRWLVVVSGKDSDLRLSFLKARTEATGLPHVKFFFFTTLEKVLATNVLTAPIWLQAGTTQPVALLTP